ncbi:MAG: 5,10-methylenetetrahydrofolate reductase [Pseudomonadota bacterium]
MHKLGEQTCLVAASCPLNAFFEKLDRGLGGIRLYGISPPKLATEPERLGEIAAQQVARLRMLAPDGLVVYDIQDEPGRSGQTRPFPFLPTVDPQVYAYDALAECALPKIVYRCVGAHSSAAFADWMHGVRAAADRRVSVFVGAPRGRASAAGLSLPEAYALAHAVPNLVLGGIAIAERHVTKADEHQRMLAKQDAGCRFFITQSVYDAGSTRSLLSDYALSLQESGRSPVPLVLTFSPCGSVRTLEFMKWLGISFPRWLENELRHSPDTLGRSIDLCESVFVDVQDYAREKHLPIGINVESISIRKSEVDASVELYRRLASRLEG